MRNREEDRARWNDPEFNKWLDEGITDCGHTVWDSVPDIGSAWNGWDAAKSALGYYCPSCAGSGEEIHVSYHGPDSFERLGSCSACSGDGRTTAALEVANARIVEMQEELSKLRAEQFWRQWKPMASCPHHKDVIFYREDAGVFSGKFTDADSFMTDAERDEGLLTEEEQFALDAWSYEPEGVYRLDGDLVPTHWMPYPGEPEVKS